jgi:hypothetical protein
LTHHIVTFQFTIPPSTLTQDLSSDVEGLSLGRLPTGCFRSRGRRYLMIDRRRIFHRRVCISSETRSHPFCPYVRTVHRGAQVAMTTSAIKQSVPVHAGSPLRSQFNDMCLTKITVIRKKQASGHCRVPHSCACFVLQPHRSRTRVLESHGLKCAI